MEAGAKVLGASSMGALRAAELDIYGMEGIGKIYQAYKSGHLVSDDEVALIFDPFSWEPRSEPLVNIRFNLDLAWQMGVISASCKDRLFHCAEARYFPERTYERMLSDAGAMVAEKELQVFANSWPGRSGTSRWKMHCWPWSKFGEWQMKVKVISFAGFRHVLGKEMQVELGEEARDMTVSDLLEALCASRPALRPLLFSGEDLREDVNVFVAGKNIASLQGIQTLLAEGDEVALFPAAIGG